MNLLDAVEIIVVNKEVRERILWLHKNTAQGLNQPLATIEILLFKNWSAGTNKELEVGAKTYTLAQLFQYCNELLTECCRLMTKMTKNYSFDIKYGDENSDTGRPETEPPMFTLGEKKT